MRHFILLFFCLMLADAVHAQLPSTGFAPDIQVSIQAGTMTCTATNYKTGAALVYNVSNVYNHVQSGGVVAWVNGLGGAFALTYDVNISQWKTTNLSSQISSTLQISDGVVTCRDQWGEVTIAIYDPTMQIWAERTVTTEGSGVQVIEGTVVVTTYTQDIYFYTYDPSYYGWNSKLEGITSGGTLEIKHDFVLWQQDNRYLYGTLYDRELHEWRTKSFGTYDPDHSYAVGVLAFRTYGAFGGMKMAAYDIDLNQWVDSTISGVQSFQVNQGTVYFRDGTGVHRFGYDSQAHQWMLESSTQAFCKNLSWQPISNPSGMIFLASKSIGGPKHYECGDGHVLYKSNVFKKFVFGGDFVVRAVIENWLGDSYCDYPITVAGPTSTLEASEAAMQVFPNPLASSGLLQIQSTFAIQQVRIIDMLGLIRFEGQGKGMEMQIEISNLQLAPGSYVLEVLLPKLRVERRKLIVER
jgi:hypothetical protein